MRLAFFASLALAVPAAAQQPLTDTAAFERADAESFWRFDACGDPLAGRMYRDALADRVRSCPFTSEAQARFVQRVRAQAKKSADMLQRLIDEHGGLPVQLDGMTRTCREQRDSAEYQALRASLEQERRGEAAPDAVFAAACDAADGP